MPKLKTKSGAKKRFKLTGTGKVKHAQSGKRHGMIKRTNNQIRNQRGTTILSETTSVPPVTALRSPPVPLTRTCWRLSPRTTPSRVIRSA